MKDEHVFRMTTKGFEACTRCGLTRGIIEGVHPITIYCPDEPIVKSMPLFPPTLILFTNEMLIIARQFPDLATQKLLKFYSLMRAAEPAKWHDGVYQGDDGCHYLISDGKVVKQDNEIVQTANVK